jgi:drug/metabolite transporter (DMT)-like permease
MGDGRWAMGDGLLAMGDGLLATGYLAVFASVAAFILFCFTVRKIGVTRANIFNNVRPVFTAILMWIIFGEILPVWKLVGIVVIIIGLFVSEKKDKNPCENINC